MHYLSLASGARNYISLPHILVVGPILDAFLLARNAKAAATFLTLFPFKDFDSFKLSAKKKKKPKKKKKGADSCFKMCAAGEIPYVLVINLPFILGPEKEKKKMLHVTIRYLLLKFASSIP